MFTGIIEDQGTISEILNQEGNRTFWISSSISNELQIDQSISHNGVCLTVEDLREGAHQVTAIEETLSKTTLGQCQTGDTINLERCMQMNGRLDGHLVQGHVDSTGKCLYLNERQGSWEIRIQFPPQFASLVVEKGSICLNGISLTIYDIRRDEFSVAIIPYTYAHTNLKQLAQGDLVNLEFDLVGKYLNRIMELRS